MIHAPVRAGLLAGLVVWSAACWSTPPEGPAGGPLDVVLVQEPGPPHVTVSGLSAAELRGLEAAQWPPSRWQKFLSLWVDGTTGPAVSADYRVVGSLVELTPKFPLDPGRSYIVKVVPAALPTPRAETHLVRTVTTPKRPAGAPVRVTAITPSASTWPENTLRFYLHFSGAMSATSAIGHVQLVDGSGAVIPDVLLEVDVDLWNTDYTRRTVFFDPGRVKRGIRPNRELGRAMTEGRPYAIVVSTSWTDASGRPLASEYTHPFVAGAAIDRGLEPNDWEVKAPTAGSLDPLEVTFPWALDAGLLARAIGVASSDGATLDGVTALKASETVWTFTPAQPWRAGDHQLVVLSLLEDPQGNRVREPFEFEMFGKPTPNAPERVSRTFTVQDGRR